MSLLTFALSAAEFAASCLVFVICIALIDIIVVPWLQDLWAGFFKEPGP